MNRTGRLLAIVLESEGKRSQRAEYLARTFERASGPSIVIFRRSAVWKASRTVGNPCPRPASPRCRAR